MVEFTTVVAVDENYCEKLRLVWPTWKRHRPEILEHPLLVICDARLRTNEWDRNLSFLDHDDLTRILWDHPAENQRERMLTALVKVPGVAVRTPWYLKLDAETAALEPAQWLQESWFAPNEHGTPPAFVASPWGYTKPPDAIVRLDDWGDRVPELQGTARLNIVPERGASRVRHKRITSWCFFGNTRWTREVASYCGERLPVPSQDTYLWYCAARRGDFYRTARMNRFGWKHFSRRRNLTSACSRALETGTAEPDDREEPHTPSEEAKNFALSPYKPAGLHRHGRDEGVCYLLTGRKHAVRLAVSLWSLRRHYDGPITVFTTRPDSHEIGQRLARDRRLAVEHREFPQQHRTKNGTFLTKIAILKKVPYETSAFLDADTLVVGDIAPLFEASPSAPFVATQFADWTTDRRVIRRRVERWRTLSQNRCTDAEWKEMIDAALQARPAINSGVFAVRKEATLIDDWYELARIGRRTFICDEIALQILLPRYPHRLLDCRFNCSPIYAADCSDVRIWHMHGGKHLRANARRRWWPACLECLQENIGGIRDWIPAGDKRLQAFLDEQDACAFARRAGSL